MEGHLLCDQPEHKAVDWRQDGKTVHEEEQEEEEEDEEEWGGHREIKTVHNHK